MQLLGLGFFFGEPLIRQVDNQSLFFSDAENVEQVEDEVPFEDQTCQR